MTKLPNRKTNETQSRTSEFTAHLLNLWQGMTDSEIDLFISRLYELYVKGGDGKNGKAE